MNAGSLDFMLETVKSKVAIEAYDNCTETAKLPVIRARIATQVIQ